MGPVPLLFSPAQLRQKDMPPTSTGRSLPPLYARVYTCVQAGRVCAGLVIPRRGLALPNSLLLPSCCTWPHAAAGTGGEAHGLRVRALTHPALPPLPPPPPLNAYPHPHPSPPGMLHTAAGPGGWDADPACAPRPTLCMSASLRQVTPRPAFDAAHCCRAGRRGGRPHCPVPFPNPFQRHHKA